MAVKTAFWAILFPVWLIVGIRFGIFTPSEAGAFAVAYALIVGVLIYRELSFAAIVDALLLSVRDIGMIMLIILLSGAFGYVITFERVPQTLAEITTGLFASKIALLFAISAFLLIFGMLVEATVIESKAGTLITLTNWRGEPIKGLTVTVNIAAPAKTIAAASGTPVKVGKNAAGKPVYTLDLDIADALILR